MVRGLLLFLAGALVGANVTYFAMTHRASSREAIALADRVAPPAPDATTTPATPSTIVLPANVPAPVATTSPAPTATRVAAPTTTVTAPGASLAMPLPNLQASQLVDTFDDLRGTDRRHEALDIAAPAGTPVLAVADGTVQKLFNSVPGGITLYQFEPSGRYAYYYAHLQGYAPGIAEGRALKRGEVIGYVGSTGNARPDAPHLHFAVFELGPEKRWWQGTAIDPYPLLGGTPKP